MWTKRFLSSFRLTSVVCSIKQSSVKDKTPWVSYKNAFRSQCSESRHNTLKEGLNSILDGEPLTINFYRMITNR